MNSRLKLAYCVVLSIGWISPAYAQLPANYQLKADWQLAAGDFQAQVMETNDASGHPQVTLSNGLVRRVFRTTPNAATVALDNLMTDQPLLRSIRPEGRITLDGVEWSIGGLSGQPNHAFLTSQWKDRLESDSQSLRFVGLEIGKPQPRMEWKQVRSQAPDSKWPPQGVSLRMDYSLPATSKNATEVATPNADESTEKNADDVRVSVHYELYDGVPVFSKWLSVENNTSKSITVDRFTAEILAAVEYENQVETREGIAPLAPDSLHVETDMAFGGFDYRNANRHTVHWRTDPQYLTQVNYLLQQPCLLEVEPTYGPSQDVPPQTTFETFRVFELLYDSSDRERRGLALRKMYRVLAPWVTENPLMLHCASSDEQVVRRAIDQAAETGFEMVILSFGSGFDSENDDSAYLGKWKQINDYAMHQGIQLGSYSLYSSRTAGDGNDIVVPAGMQNAHGRCPAITSSWGQEYLKKLYNLFDKTGFLVFENDGPYPGDVDITARLPLQKGEQDSRWVHWRTWTDLYKHLRGRGVYLNLPDYYYLSGSNKCGMGYRETNWSLPREEQRIHTRQNIYDGTWEKTPSMGWMFVPLVTYHGGGEAATIEPLEQHLDHYEIMMKSNLGLGVQACYRGPRLYDTEKTKSMVTGVVSWYKKHRAILESDVIHGRRADGQDIDWMLHVNPGLAERAMLSAYNPTATTITKSIMIPLYYSGLKDSATASINDGESTNVNLDSHQRTKLELTIPAQGYAYVVFAQQ